MMRRSICLLALLLVPLAASQPDPFIGPMHIISDGPVALQPPAVGNDFIAWISITGGTGDVHIRLRGGDEVFTLTQAVPGEESNDAVAAYGPHVAWSRSRMSRPAAGEAAVINSDLVVYDVVRGAEIYDSRSPAVDEAAVVAGRNFVGYLADDHGTQRLFGADVTGSEAFLPKPLREGGDQFQPAMAGDTAVFLEKVDAGQQVVAVHLVSKASVVLAPAVPGIGYAAPTVGDGRIAWVEHQAGRSGIRVMTTGGDPVGYWPGDGVQFQRVALGDDIVVASVIDEATGLRTLRAWCLPDGVPVAVGPGDGVVVRPTTTSWGTVAMLRQVGDDFFVYERELRCTEIVGDDQGVPGGWALLPLLIAFAVMRRR